MEIDKGYISPYFITDREKKEAILENPMILITDQTVNSAQDLLPSLEASMQQKRPLLIIAKDVEGEALATLVLNVASRVVKAAAIKAPGFGDEQGELLEDIATLTGASVLAKDKSADIKSQGPTSLGGAEKVIIAKNKTTFVGGEGNKDLITERTEMLRSQEKLSKSKWDKEKMQKRIGKMTGGVAVLRIGAATETEMKEKKARVDDALNATRAAMAEGVVVGGGVALLRARDALSGLMETSSGDRSIGIQAVYDALSAPLRQISENAGEEPSVVVSKVLENKSESFGYNARNKEYVDLLKEGVIDPVKVTRNALNQLGQSLDLS